MNDEINELMEDLHTINGHPHSIYVHTDTPIEYRDHLRFICTRLVEAGWKKEQV